MSLLRKDLGEYTLGEVLFGKVCKLNPGRWEKLCPKIGNNEMSANESLPLDNDWYSCM